MNTGYERMSWAELGPAKLQIQRIKPIRHDTELVSADGTISFVIACPDDAVYRDLAYELQEAYVGSLAGPARVLRPEQISENHRRNSHIIALGNIGNNSLLAELYHSYYVAVDQAYPGRGGHVLQTVYDPWGYGTNVIVCGGSDFDGVQEAVQGAVNCLRSDGKRLWLPRLHNIIVSAQFMARYPTISFECTAEHHRELVELAYHRIEAGEHRRAMPVLSHAGLMYNLTGDDRFADAYRDVFKVVYQSAVNDPGTGPWSPWGFDADFQSAPVLGAWDVVEECPVLTDEDRLYMTNHLLWYVQYIYEHAQHHRPTKPGPRHNHYTFAALGLLYGAKYFQKYYNYPEVKDWLAEVDECFRTQTTAFKANEDCNSYQWLTFYHTLKYALVRPDPAFIVNGNARLCLDLGIANMDNLGYQVPYGDVREYSGTFSEVPYYKAVVALLKDPAYQPVLERKERVKPRFEAGRTPLSAFPPNGIQPVGYEYELDLGRGRELKRFFGVTKLPVEPLYFQAFDGPQHIEYAKAFDKIVFRHSLDPEDDYLLLDGLSNGGHLHYDGNAVVRYTSKGRIWLADADYMKVSQKFHNSVLVFKDGRGSLIPPYMEFEEATWLPPFGYSRSVARDYSGTDWTRHILELRGRHFLVMDEVQAREAGNYSFRCLWRTVGNVSLEPTEKRFTVEQEGPIMELRSAPGWAAPTRLVLKEEPMIWGTWDRYPYHGDSPNVKVLQERASAVLSPGERYVFFNLFGTEGPYPQLSRLAEGLARIEGDVAALVGTGQELAAGLPELETDAAFAYVSPGKLFLASASNLSVGENQILDAPAPVSLLLDLDSGATTMSASQEMEMRLGGKWFRVQPGVQAVSSSDLAPLRPLLQAIGKSPAQARAEKVYEPVKERLRDRLVGRLAWELELPDRRRPYCLCLHRSSSGEKPTLFVGTVEGSVFRIDDNGISWEFETRGRVNGLAVADVNDDGSPEVIVGSADQSVYLLDPSGKEIWHRELPYYLHQPTVESVMAVDVGLPRGQAVLAGTNACHVHALSPDDGHELWRFEVIHGVNDLAAADMNGDGVDEILAVTEWWTWHCIDAKGNGLWRHWAVRPHYTPGANVVEAADVNGDGMPEMLVGAIDTCVYAFDSSGARLWEFFTGEEISVLQCLDLDGDQVADIVAGSLNGYLYALNGQGQELWHTGLEEEINSLVALQISDELRLVTGTDDGSAFVLSKSGEIVAIVDVGRPLRKLAATSTDAGITIYAACRDGRIAAYHVTVD